MEALEELMGGGPKDHTHIIKGKRTKRQRLQSPIPFSMATPKSSSGDADNAYSSAEFAEGATTEEEEEDLVANCLILLAQGRSIHPPKSSKSTPGLRFTSKRFLEAPFTGSGKVGMFVYQCKTCDRTFPTFQALGGHRASHKRPKQAVVEVKKKKKMLLLSYDDEEEEGEIKDHIASSLSLQLDNKPNCNTKVHECSICGAEFLSGQALGGHMRRHRASGGTNTILSLSPIGCECEDHQETKMQRTPISLNPIGCESEDQEARKQTIVLSLDLDLNLPAPGDDQLGESKYAFNSKQQSPPVLPTVPTLVDCQY